MAPSGKTILVTGATGNQGGAVIDHLLEAEGDYEIRGLTRDPNSEAARALADRGVEMVAGNLNDPASLRSPLQDVDGAFGVTNFWLVGQDQQVQQGKNLVDAAADAGVNHLVFSGIAGQHREVGISHFDSTWEIEKYVQDQELPATFLRPAYFYQNFEVMVEDVVDGTLALPLAQDVSLQMVDMVDVGRAAAVAFSDPESYVGESIDLVGDEHTLASAAALLSEVTGVDVHPYHIPVADAREEAGDEYADMFAWFNEAGWNVDQDAVESKLGIELTPLEEYLRANGWEDKSGPASIPGWIKAMEAGGAE